MRGPLRLRRQQLRLHGARWLPPPLPLPELPPPELLPPPQPGPGPLPPLELPPLPPLELPPPELLLPPQPGPGPLPPLELPGGCGGRGLFRVMARASARARA